jgi:septal ring factor EnvC (AmiA/AmiB activator)
VSAPHNPQHGAPAAAPQSEVSANVKFAGELRRFLELGAAQLDAAIRESDARVDKLAGAVTAVATDARELETQVQALDSADAAEVQQARQRIRQLVVQLDADVQATVTSLQFYDKLIQRLTHVRDGLAIPSDSTVGALDPARSDWNSMLEQVRSRYSMVEERVLFDFMMRGLSADQMLKALTGLRAAAAPGELEVF